MPDLSDLLKDAVGEIPAFDAGALVAKERHRRQLQAAGAASTAAAVALFVGVAFNHGSGGSVAIKTTADVTSAPPTADSSSSRGLDRQHDELPTLPVDTTRRRTTTSLTCRGPEPRFDDDCLEPAARPCAWQGRRPCSADPQRIRIVLILTSFAYPTLAFLRTRPADPWSLRRKRQGRSAGMPWYLAALRTHATRRRNPLTALRADHRGTSSR